MIRETFPVGLLQCNCTILGDEQSREAIVVDPGDDLPRILATLAKHRLTVQQILVTHAHIDHIAGAQQLQRLTGAAILYNRRDLPLVAMAAPEVSAPDADLTDELPVHIEGIDGVTLHTPGHTPGSICLYFPSESLLLSGDTLFAGSVGRSDLPGGDGAALIRSIHERLLVLPDPTLVIPGHGESTSIELERKRNPFLQSL